jgi:crotonobetainyl-CoA:carnitine CoA-transferase CaiB-like acyl-CoA transferase
MTGALDGSRILDLTTHLAGPFCTMLLGDLGADVIKIEQPPLGDPIRAREDDTGYAPSFVPQNRNKRSILLDLKSESGRAILQRMIPDADVLVTSMRPRARARLGLDYADVAAINPALVYCALSGYGETEAARERPVFDTSALALSGLLTTLTDALDDPMRIQLFLSDQLAGQAACYAILAALLARVRTGRGQEVKTSLLAASIAFANYSFHHVFAARARGEKRNRLTYRTAGFLLRAADDLPFAAHVAPAPAKNWDAFTTAMERPDLRDDSRFADRRGREQNYVELHAILSAHAKTRDRAHWLDRLDRADIPAAPVNALGEVFDDKIVQALGLLHDVTDPWGATGPAVGSGITMSDTPVTALRRAPLPGEHSREILAAFGFPASEIDHFVADGTVVARASV